MIEYPKRESNRKIVAKLTVAAIAMFAFGFALVPLYDVFCDLTGLNGKTGRIEATELAKISVDKERTVEIEFLSNLNRSLQSEFHPQIDKITVHPGEVKTVKYYVKNNTSRNMIVHAVPSVAPVKASAYFDKIECFCFDQQELKAGEAKELPVTFVVKPSLPKEVQIISLAYTLYDVTESTEKTASK